jgi:hypothetical protein
MLIATTEDRAIILISVQKPVNHSFKSGSARIPISRAFLLEKKPTLEGPLSLSIQQGIF